MPASSRAVHRYGDRDAHSSAACFGTIAPTFLLAHAAPSCAENLHGAVTRVIDGDMLILRDLEHHMSVQLEGVAVVRR